MVLENENGPASRWEAEPFLKRKTVPGLEPGALLEGEPDRRFRPWLVQGNLGAGRLRNKAGMSTVQKISGWPLN
jgi:hypothetical protein